jgi:EmrB/QacA subfamily drug resistance transporter
VRGSARRQVLLVAGLATFLAFLDVTIVNVAFPAIERSFEGASRPTLSWILNAYNVVFAALLLPAGRLGDVLGHRRVFMAGVLAFTVASAACAAAPSIDVLIAARGAQAMGAALVMPSALALLLSAVPPDQRTAAVAFGAAAAGVAAALGPSIGGLLVELSEWRVAFLVNVPLGVFILHRAAAIAETEQQPGPLPDLSGTTLLTGAVALTALALVQGPQWGWRDPRVLGAFAAAVALVPAFVRRTRRHTAPALDLSLLRVRDFAVANAATLIFAAAFFAKILCDVLFLTSVWRYSLLTAGLALTPSPLITAAAAGSAGRLAERHGHRALIAAGALLYAAGSAWYALAITDDPAYVTRFLPMTVLTGVGIACALPLLTSAAVTALGPERWGVGSGANATARQLGGVLGVAILVAIVGTPTPTDALARFHAGWAFVAIASGLTAAVACALSPRRLDQPMPHGAPLQPTRAVPQGEAGGWR